MSRGAKAIVLGVAVAAGCAALLGTLFVIQVVVEATGAVWLPWAIITVGVSSFVAITWYRDGDRRGRS